MTTEPTAPAERLQSLLRHLSLPTASGITPAAEASSGEQEKPKLAIICTVWYYLTHAQHEGDRFNHGWPMNGAWHEPEVQLVSLYCDQCDSPHPTRLSQSLSPAVRSHLGVHPHTPCPPFPTHHHHTRTPLTPLSRDPHLGVHVARRKDDTEVHPHHQDDPDVPKGDLSAARAEEWGLTVYDTIADALRCGGEALAVDAVLLIGEHGQYPVDEYSMTHWPRYEFFTAITDEIGRAHV